MKKKCVVGGVFLLLLFLVLAMSTALAEHVITVNMVKNGGFEDGSGLYYATHWTGFDANDWMRKCGWASPDLPHTGDCVATNYQNYIYQNIDFTEVDEITFYYKTGGSKWLKIYIGGVLIYDETLNKVAYTKETIDVSGITGIKQLKFVAYAVHDLWLDDVTANIEVDLETIRNPSFEQQLGDDSLVQWDTWTDVDMVSGSHSESVAQSGDTFFRGAQSLKLVADVNGVGTTAAGVTQKIDLSSSTPYLNFWMYSEGGEGDAAIVVAVDGTPVWEYAGETLWQEFSAPLSGYYGTSRVSIYATASDGSSITAYIDDVAFGEEKATISGYTYDAAAGIPLPNAAIRIDSVWGSSNNLGFYSINALPGIHTITATKPDYYDAVLPITVTHTGDYVMDIALISKPTSYLKPSILGVVQTLPNYQPAKNQVVKIKTATWATSTTTNDFGYYAFHNLEAGSYYVNVTKRGDAPSSHLITIADTSVLHNIELEPTEWSIIEVIIEKVMEWWWLLLLLIALVGSALLMRGRKKVYAQHPKRGKKR